MIFIDRFFLSMYAKFLNTPLSQDRADMVKMGGDMKNFSASKNLHKQCSWQGDKRPQSVVCAFQISWLIQELSEYRNIDSLTRPLISSYYGKVEHLGQSFFWWAIRIEVRWHQSTFAFSKLPQVTLRTQGYLGTI